MAKGLGQNQPLLDEAAESPGGARLPFRYLLVTTVSMPLIGFLFCVVWSLVDDFESATSTHCKVANYLPSLSAAIGNFPVQRRVWQTLIGLHAAPRFLFCYLYWDYWRKVLNLACLGCLLRFFSLGFYVTENIGLLGLSFVTSTEDFPFHKKAFTMFLVSAGFYMLLTCQLCRMPRVRPVTRRERASNRRKLVLFVVYCTCLTLAMYFYHRHDTSCEAGIYTLFALSEYVVVLSNIAFHATAYWDFYDKVFELRSCKWT